MPDTTTSDIDLSGDSDTDELLSELRAWLAELGSRPHRRRMVGAPGPRGLVRARPTRKCVRTGDGPG